MADQLGGASGNATPAQLLTGYTASVASGPISGTMPENGSLGTITPGTSAKSIPAGHTTGGTVAGDADLIAANIKAGVNIFGVAGSALRQASGTFTLPGTTSSYTVSGLTFTPRVIYMEYQTTNTGLPNVDISGLEQSQDGTSYSAWKQSVVGYGSPVGPAAQPTGGSITFNQAFSSSYTMYMRWYAYE